MKKKYKKKKNSAKTTNIVKNDEDSSSRRSMVNERAWSDLPELLLWMIIGRLDIVGKLRFGLACKHWRNASTCCPRKFKPSTNTEPWVMARTENSKDIMTFIKFSTNNKSLRAEFKFSHEDFAGATFRTSKDGWLLFSRTRDVRWDRTMCDLTLFFINPVTKSTIKMPFWYLNSTLTHVTAVAFSTVDDVPHRVVIAESTTWAGDNDTTNNLVIATVGGDHGTTWNYVYHSSNRSFCGMTILDNRYVVTNSDQGHHGIVCFDLSKWAWVKELTRQMSETAASVWTDSSKCWYVDFEGELFKVLFEELLRCREDTAVRKFECYKLDWVERTWARVKETELRGICFYYDSCRVCMSRGEKDGLHDIHELRSWGDRHGPPLVVLTYRSSRGNHRRLKSYLSDAYFVEMG